MKTETDWTTETDKIQITVTETDKKSVTELSMVIIGLLFTKHGLAHDLQCGYLNHLCLKYIVNCLGFISTSGKLVVTHGTNE